MRALPTPAARSLTLSPSMAGRHVRPYATGRLRESTKALWPRPGLLSNEWRASARPGSAARGCGNGDGGARRGGSGVWAPELRRRAVFVPTLGFLGSGGGSALSCSALLCPPLAFYRLRTVRPFLSTDNSISVKLLCEEKR